jgi:hypothetical protein
MSVSAPEADSTMRLNTLVHRGPSWSILVHGLFLGRHCPDMANTSLKKLNGFFFATIHLRVDLAVSWVVCGPNMFKIVYLIVFAATCLDRASAKQAMDKSGRIRCHSTRLCDSFRIVGLPCL